MSTTEVMEKIRKEIDDNPVLLYMKGSKEAPMCGFSAQVVHVLKSYNVPFETRDVLQDWELREGIKEFANWPTIPQLYVKGQFVGGCDITMDLHRQGKLGEILQKVAQ